MTNVVVTGCNRGIGFELCKQLKARGDAVTGVCRQSNEQLDALDIEVIDGVDVSTGDGVTRLKEALGDTAVDVLINNAGIVHRDRFEEMDFEAMAEQFRVNSLGPLRVTRALIDNLHPGSKIAIVTSRMGSIEDNGSGGYYGYRASKTAVNMLGVTLARDLEPRGIAVALLHPGMVATDMTGGQGVEVGTAASGLIQRVDELSMETSGGFWHAEGYALPW